MKKTIFPEGLGFGVEVEEIKNTEKIMQKTTSTNFIIEAYGLRFTGPVGKCYSSSIIGDRVLINEICVYTWGKKPQQQKEPVKQEDNENHSLLLDESIKKELPIKVNASQNKYQQLFFYNIEAPLEISNFKMFLTFKSFLKVKESFQLLDTDKKNLKYVKDALNTVLDAQFVMAHKINDLKFSPTKNFKEDLELFKKIYKNLDCLGEKLLGKSAKLSKK